MKNNEKQFEDEGISSHQGAMLEGVLSLSILTLIAIIHYYYSVLLLHHYHQHSSLTREPCLRDA